MIVASAATFGDLFEPVVKLLRALGSGKVGNGRQQYRDERRIESAKPARSAHRRVGFGAPRAEAGRLWAHQLQLTIADFVDETHDTHHPIASSLYYEDQGTEARARSADFRRTRMSKYLGYFENVLSRNPAGGGHLIGRRLSYPDLSLFHLVAGLRYAFPRRMSAIAAQYPHVSALHNQVAARPRIAAYLASDRRLPFNEHGIFRHYPELDGTD